MFEQVTPVFAARPTTGLVASAVTPNDDVRWQNGIAWRSERCPTASGFDPCGDTFETPVGSGGDELNYYRPVAFRVTDECATRTRTFDQERVRRQAEAATSWMVARELEDAPISHANPYISPSSTHGHLFQPGDLPSDVNAHLTMATAAQIVAGAPHTPLVALGLLEEASRDAQLGMDPFIHVAPRLVPLLETALERQGSLLLTKTGARVVADSGYTGKGPWDAGTSEVQTVTITGTPTGGTFRLTFDGHQTAPIAYNATSADLETALENLPNLGAADVAVTGGPGPGTPYTVTFAATLGNVPQMTLSNNSLTGGVAPTVVIVTTTPGVNPVTMPGDWMYATGPVQVRLDPVQVLPDLVWRENRWLMIAERLFAAYFDPCTLRAVAVTVPEPA